MKQARWWTWGVAVLVACEGPAAPGAASPSASSSSAAAPAGASAPSKASAAAPRSGALSGAPARTSRPRPDGETGDDTFEIRSFTMTTGVKDREPQGKLVAAGAGERAYAHLAVRNRRSDEERISVRFLVAGDERTTVDLTVKRSWQYRTWAYVTPRRGDAGKKLEVEVRDASGALLASTSLPIEATKRVTEQKAEWEEKGEER